MRFGSGALLVAVGLLILWLAVSGKLTNLSSAWATLNGEAAAGTTGVDNALNSLTKSFPAEAFPTLPMPVPSLN